MNPASKKRWLLPATAGVAAVGAIVVTLALFVRVGEGTRASGQPGHARPGIHLVSAEQTDQERRQLTDLEPLFLPTKFNTSVLALPAEIRREPGSMSVTFPAKLTFADAGRGLPLPEFIPLPERPVEILRLGEPPNPLAELHRADVTIPPLPKRLAYIEVRGASDGRVVFAESLPRPTERTLAVTDWSPLEFMLAVDAAGLVGAPAVMKPTSSEEVQEFFRVFVARQLHLGARLAPGFYTVHIGP